MNIFVTNPDPVKSAQALDDGRVNKMITESLQMLAVVMHKYGVPHQYIPKNQQGDLFSAKAYANHPCTIWAGHTGNNFMWLVQHTEALCHEFWIRHGRQQRGYCNTHDLSKALPYLPIGDLTPFANCSMFKDLEVCEAYRRTLFVKWNNNKPKYKLTWWGQAQFPGWP